MALAPSPSPNRLAGLASVTIAGRTYMLASNFKYRPSKVERETLPGMDGIHGFKEVIKAGRISMTLRDAAGMSVAAFNAMVNVSIQAQLANGKVIVGNNMWAVESQEVESMEATFDVAFEGNDVSEN